MARTKNTIPTKAEIRRFLKFEQRRKEANRLADDLERQCDPLKLKIKAHVEAVGGPERAVIHHDFRLAIEQVNGAVSWKDAFLEVAGEEEAAQRRANAPKRDLLKVEPAPHADAA